MNKQKSLLCSTQKGKLPKNCPNLWSFRRFLWDLDKILSENFRLVLTHILNLINLRENIGEKPIPFVENSGTCQDKPIREQLTFLFSDPSAT